MAYWLVKTEESVYSIDDLKKDGNTHWHGVRNYQARNFLKEMQQGDMVFIYHSVEEPVGIAGVAKVSKVAYPDPSQFDKKSEYFDPKASEENPRWFCPEIKFVEKFKNILELKTLKADKQLKDMMLLQKGSRLSVQKVSKENFDYILETIRKS